MSNRYFSKFKLLSLQAVMLMVFNSCVGLQNQNVKINALKPNGTSQPICLARNNRTATIIIPSKPTTLERNAATELKKTLEVITGEKFTIASDKVKPDGVFISVGNTIQAKKAGFSDLPSKLGKEGVAVKPHGGNLFLLAGPKGIMNAVMAFLEEDLGCRWYSDEWNYIPHDKNLTAMVVDRTSLPDFNSRFVFTATAMSSDPDWTTRNRVMKWNRFNHVKNWFCHTYERICPMSEFKKHPDLFAKRANGKPFNTQICPTNPEIVKRAVARVLSALRKNRDKDADLIAIAENDGSTGYCHCPRCEKINKKYGSPIAAHLFLVNSVARAIKKEFPDITVDYIVYSKDFRKPPIGIKMEPNTEMWFCSNNVGVNKCYRHDAKAVAEFEKWKKISNGKFNVWEYGCDYGDYFRVTPSLHAKIDNLRFWKENGADGIMFLEVFGARGGDQQALRAWILSKMLWDSSRDPDKLVLDFCEGVFGEAAPEMYEYYKLVEKAGLAEKISNGKFNVWEYGCDYGDYFRVTPSLHAKIDNLRFWKENGADGIMFLEVFGARGGDQQALRAWILSKMLWDSSRDPDKLVLDFCEGVFGEAAPEMYEYYKLVEKAGLAEESVEKYYGKAEFIAKANKIFDKAYATADKTGNIELRHRIDVQYVPIAFMEINSIFQAYPGNKKNFPTERYNKLLNDIKRITKRENMGGYSEVRGMPGYIKELELLERTQKNGALWIYAINGTLYKYPIRKDPLATKGKAPLLPCDDNWLVQWAFPANLCVPGVKYQLRASVRPLKDSQSDNVASGGVYFKPGKIKTIDTEDDSKARNVRTKAMSDKKSFTDHIDGRSLSSKKYRWVAIGKPFIPEKNSYIWFAAKSGSDIGGLFVDKIELRPVENTKK